MKPAQLSLLIAILATCGCEQQGGNAQTVSVHRSWTRAAPIIDGYSDPTRIIYDDAYLRSYGLRNQSNYCGDAAYEIATPEGTVWVQGGLDELKLGQRFRMLDLLRFLQTRRENPIMEQVFPIHDVTLLKRLRDDNHGWDPWLEDLRIVLTLVGGAGYKPAIPLVTDLAKNDPDARIRSGAVLALGLLAHKHVEALDVLVNIAEDPATRSDDAMKKLARQTVSQFHWAGRK